MGLNFLDEAESERRSCFALQIYHFSTLLGLFNITSPHSHRSMQRDLMQFSIKLMNSILYTLNLSIFATIRDANGFYSLPFCLLSLRNSAEFD